MSQPNSSNELAIMFHLLQSLSKGTSMAQRVQTKVKPRTSMHNSFMQLLQRYKKLNGELASIPPNESLWQPLEHTRYQECESSAAQLLFDHHALVSQTYPNDDSMRGHAQILSQNIMFHIPLIHRWIAQHKSRLARMKRLSQDINPSFLSALIKRANKLIVEFASSSWTVDLHTLQQHIAHKPIQHAERRKQYQEIIVRLSTQRKQHLDLTRDIEQTAGHLDTFMNTLRSKKLRPDIMAADVRSAASEQQVIGVYGILQGGENIQHVSQDLIRVSSSVACGDVFTDYIKPRYDARHAFAMHALGEESMPALICSIMGVMKTARIVNATCACLLVRQNVISDLLITRDSKVQCRMQQLVHLLNPGPKDVTAQCNSTTHVAPSASAQVSEQAAGGSSEQAAGGSSEEEQKESPDKAEDASQVDNDQEIASRTNELLTLLEKEAWSTGTEIVRERFTSIRNLGEIISYAVSYFNAIAITDTHLVVQIENNAQTHTFTLLASGTNVDDETRPYIIQSYVACTQQLRGSPAAGDNNLAVLLAHINGFTSVNPVIFTSLPNHDSDDSEVSQWIVSQLVNMMDE